MQQNPYLQLQEQRKIRGCFMPVIIFPDDGIDEEVARQSALQSVVKSEVDKMFHDFSRTGKMDFISIMDNLSYLGDEYADAVLEELTDHYSLYQHGYVD
ncbi:hypothetical protein BI308_25980 [Roseofilum reptotaenium AO1-A]|uniref:Uncharacterized protein n=1 Tax=Roseofilum reptotaenium AO1-A TaxID=1925591 RepID=A0A1L9QA95_9CYAN|nr:hypothetical protein BI308_25980 [Roseofilum reptotaenium AO1-A]